MPSPEPISPSRTQPVGLADLAAGVRAGDRAMLGRAITLVESRKPEHVRLAGELLQALLPASGNSRRLGITGVPGVGKSTLIDHLGSRLTAAGHRVAVLAVDPSSSRTGGSILGDKTRMARLGQDPRAFIRPSPSSGTLGGVARKTRETMLLVEAAGFDVVIVETVGVGQSETAVAGMVDCFLVLMLPGAGDELQGLKKGLIEIADLIAINKADGDNLARARLAAAEYEAALNIIGSSGEDWRPPVLLTSGASDDGLEELWQQVESHRTRLTATGEWAERRRRQAVAWLHELLRERLLGAFQADARLAARLAAIEVEVRDGRLTPGRAVDELAAMVGLP